MKYQSLEDTKRVMKELLGRNDLEVSLYLPYGVLGESEDRCRIARKNVCDSLVEDARLTPDDPLMNRILAIRDEVSEKGRREQRSTRCMFLGSGAEVDFWLPGTVAAMYAIGKPAVEPLADYVGRTKDYFIVVCDLTDVHLLKCQGRTAQRIDWQVPTYLQEYYGEPDCWSMELVRETRDKYNERATLYQKSWGVGPTSLAEREFNLKDKEVFYFARMIGELVAETWKWGDTPLYLAQSSHHESFFRSALEPRNLQSLTLSVADVKSGEAFNLILEQQENETIDLWSGRIGEAHPNAVVHGSEDVEKFALAGRLGDVFVNRRIWDTRASDVTRIRRLDKERFHSAVLASLATGAKLHCLPDGELFRRSDIIGLKRFSPDRTQEMPYEAGLYQIAVGNGFEASS